MQDVGSIPAAGNGRLAAWRKHRTTFPAPPTAGPFDPWPGGGATVFSPNFLCTGKPGNPYLLKVAPPPALGSSSDSGLSGGAIAGIVVGSVAAAALAAGLAFFLVRRRRRQRATAAAADAEKGGAGAAALGTAAKGGGTGPAGPAGSTPGGSKLSSDLEGLGSAKESQFASGSMDSAFAAAAAGPDTDLAQLPADWNTGGCGLGRARFGGCKLMGASWRCLRPRCL